ncbi:MULTISPECIES: PAAR domain-containing protein [Ralstonia]|uniref:PAAR domain-containing protein n=1 Tax=Ralstonia TaxID=48736 RepID=UPI002873129D|nr:PAAR domain-containing protein [Ralstonia pickettii]
MANPLPACTTWWIAPLHGPNSISKVSPDMLIDGQPAALHGDMTECGATLIGDGSAVVI